MLTSMSSMKIGTGAFAGSSVHQVGVQIASGNASRLPPSQWATVRGIPALLRSIVRTFLSVRYLQVPKIEGWPGIMVNTDKALGPYLPASTGNRPTRL